MAEEWTLGQGFRSASKQETDTESDQQAGEVPYHGEALVGGCDPGYGKQSVTPGSAAGRSGRRVGIKLSTNVNGFGPKGVASPQETKESGNESLATG